MNGNVAIIPARGGSKRIPRKNIVVFEGLPLIGHAIQVAKDCGLFEKIIVTTDDEEISNIAIQFGAEVPRLRSNTLSDDFTSTVDVIADAIGEEWLGNWMPEFVCCIYPATPLLMPNHIIAGYEKIIQGEQSYVFPAVSFSEPIERSFKLNKEGRIILNYPNNTLTRTQDLQKSFFDAGQFYWGSYQTWSQKVTIHNDNSIAIPYSKLELIDIDNIEDLIMANCIHTMREKTKHHEVQSKNNQS